MGKEKKDKRNSAVGCENDKEEKWDKMLSKVGVIANPLATRKLSKKIYKLIKQAQGKKQLRKGVKEVQKFVRKGEKGMVIIAGDTHPIEVVCHMPCVCEDLGLVYCYTPSKEDLGSACESKRPCCMVMVKSHESYEDLYSDVHQQVKNLPLPVS